MQSYGMMKIAKILKRRQKGQPSDLGFLVGTQSEATPARSSRSGEVGTVAGRRRRGEAGLSPAGSDGGGDSGPWRWLWRRGTAV